VSTTHALEKRSRRRFSALALIGALALTPVVVSAEEAVASGGCTASAAYSGGGDGSDADKAIKISSAGDLMKLSATSADWGKFFVQDAEDIDMTGCTWTPIGNGSPRFSGRFDGDGNTISNLVVDNGGNFFGGFFGATLNAELVGIHLRDVNVSNGSNLGGLVGDANNTAIKASSVQGSVAGGDQVGGLVGQLDPDSVVSRSFSTASVTATGGSVGGLAGQVFGATVEYSFAEGPVSGVSSVGGLVGWLTSSSGFGAPLRDSLISDSYALGDVTGSGNGVGGLVGQFERKQDRKTEVKRSFSAGAVQGMGLSIGGFVGEVTDPSNPNAGDTIADSFWDTTKSQRQNGIGSGTVVESLIGKSTTEMKTFATFDNAGWPIVAGFEPFDSPNTVWGICSGEDYPYLLWQFDTDPFAAGLCAVPAAASGSAVSASSSPAIHLELKAKVADVVAGAPVLMEGQGLKPGSSYSLVVRSTPVTVKSGVASPSGTFSHTVGLPAGIAPGVHTITLTGTGPGGETLVLTQSFTVASNGTFSAIGSVTGQVTGGLAVTGPSEALLLGGGSLAALLLLLGVSLVVARRNALV